MENALKAVNENKMNIYKAARSFNVPPQTLRDRVTGHVKGTGGHTLLSKEEEQTLVEHVTIMSQLGYGYTHTQLRHFAGDLAQSLGRKANSKPLSNNWLYGFLERWQETLSSLKPSKLESNRAKCATPEVVENYYKELKSVLDKYDLHTRPDLSTT